MSEQVEKGKDPADRGRLAPGDLVQHKLRPGERVVVARRADFLGDVFECRRWDYKAGEFRPENFAAAELEPWVDGSIAAVMGELAKVRAGDVASAGLSEAAIVAAKNLIYICGGVSIRAPEFHQLHMVPALELLSRACGEPLGVDDVEVLEFPNRIQRKAAPVKPRLPMRPA